jgi:predicted Zn-dependent protease
VELGDRKGHDEIFGRILAQPKDVERDYYYLALVHYADGLARFSDDRAWDYFEEAIALHPENSLETINLYAKHLLDQGQAQKAFEVLDNRLTSEQRVNSVMPASLRQQAMKQASLDTTSADAEIALIMQRWNEGSLAGYSPAENSNGEATVVTSATADSRVSTIFGIRTADSKIKQDAIFTPNGAMNNRWVDMDPTKTALKLATLK